MNIERIESLLEGAEPSLEDYGFVVAVAEHCPPEILWKLLTSFPEMNPLMRLVINKVLHEKIPRCVSEQAADSIITELKKRLGV